ncbi:hypothetical protein V6N13_142249 [Hibiscus sabdariffa]
MKRVKDKDATGNHDDDPSLQAKIGGLLPGETSFSKISNTKDYQLFVSSVEGSHKRGVFIAKEIDSKNSKHQVLEVKPLDRNMSLRDDRSFKDVLVGVEKTRSKVLNKENHGNEIESISDKTTVRVSIVVKELENQNTNHLALPKTQ